MPTTPPPYRPPPDNGLAVIHADSALVVLAKPAGLLSVPGRGEDKADCLWRRARLRFAEALIVHRLDMETSGLIVLALGADNQRRLSASFERREVDKRYVAVVAGRPSPEAGTIELPLITDWPNRPRQIVDHERGKPSRTGYATLDHDPGTNRSRMRLEPVTGRSHQLRVHMLALGHPILGDALYAPPAARDAAGRLLLHAEWLAFPHPLTGEPCEFHCPAPF